MVFGIDESYKKTNIGRLLRQHVRKILSRIILFCIAYAVIAYFVVVLIPKYPLMGTIVEVVINILCIGGLVIGIAFSGGGGMPSPPNVSNGQAAQVSQYRCMKPGCGYTESGPFIGPKTCLRCGGTMYNR